MKFNRIFLILFTLILMVQPLLMVKTSPVKAAGIGRPEPTSMATSDIQINLPLIYKTVSAERAALIALYNSTDGDNWANNSGWNTDSPYCGWYGVICDSTDHVTSLILDQNYLEGTIPPEIGNLVDLKTLNLSNQQICGKGGCDREPSKLTGLIPAEIGRLANLQELDLSYNALTDIPVELGNLVNLQTLDLSVNQLAGSIPPEIGNLVKLEKLSLFGNQLSGSIPPEIGNLVNLQVLYLFSNPLLSGAIPPEIGNLVCGTETFTVAAVVLPESSAHSTVMV